MIDNLDIRGAQHLTFDGIDFTHDVGIVYANVDDPGGPVASDIVIHGGRMQTFHIISAKNITIDGVDIGHYYYSDGFSSNWVATHEGFPSSRNILIENSTFQGIRRGRTPAAGAGIHAECLFTQRVNGLTVRGNKFIGCPIYSLAFYDATTGPGADSNSARNILIENNFISCGNEVDPCADAVDFATKGYETIANVTVRFNSSNDAFNFDGSAPLFRNNRAYGNVAQHVDCETSGWAQSYNVVAAGSCGGTNRHAPSGFVTSSWQGDFHVVRGAPALGAVPLRFCRKYGCPSADIDGDPRPLRAGADAGADQRDPAAIIFAKGIGAVALGQSKTQVDATYGRARWVRSLRTNRRTSPLQVFSYRPHGRTLWVVYDGDRATGVGTPSVYYTTRGGLGPGVAIPRAQAAAFRLMCRGTYRRAAGSAVASITRAGRPPNWRVGTIWVYSASLARLLGCGTPRP